MCLILIKNTKAELRKQSTSFSPSLPTLCPVSHQNYPPVVSLASPYFPPLPVLTSVIAIPFCVATLIQVFFDPCPHCYQNYVSRWSNKEREEYVTSLHNFFL